MNEEIKKFLKENLKIKTSHDRDDAAEIQLILDGEIISTSRIFFK